MLLNKTKRILFFDWCLCVYMYTEETEENKELDGMTTLLNFQ